MKKLRIRHRTIYQGIPETEDSETGAVELDISKSYDRIAVPGPDGEISINLSSRWIREICPPENNELTIEL